MIARSDVFFSLRKKRRAITDAEKKKISEINIMMKTMVGHFINSCVDGSKILHEKLAIPVSCL